MLKILFATVIGLFSTASFADAPAAIKMKCTLNNLDSSVEEVLTFEYGAGQKVLSISGDAQIIVEVADQEPRSGLHDVKMYLKDSIVSASGVAVSSNQANGVHVVSTSKGLSSIFCGI